MVNLMSLQLDRQNYVANSSNPERFMPSMAELITYIAIAIVAVAGDQIIFSNIRSIFLDLMAYTFYYEFILPLFSGIIPFWIILARSLTRSQIGGTITGFLFGNISNVFYMSFYILDASPEPVSSDLSLIVYSIISLVTLSIMGIIIDIWFSMKIQGIILFILASGIAMIARGVMYFILASLFGFRSFSIMGLFFTSPISGVINGGVMGFIVSSIIIKLQILPFEPSRVMETVTTSYPSYTTVNQSSPVQRSFSDELEPAVMKETPPRVEKPVKVTSPGVDKLRLFRNAISRSKSIPFNIATDVLGFSTEKELISWLWEIDLPGFEIDYTLKTINISGAGEEVTDAIDKLLEKYKKMEEGGEGKI